MPPPPFAGKNKRGTMGDNNQGGNKFGGGQRQHSSSLGDGNNNPGTGGSGDMQ